MLTLLLLPISLLALLILAPLLVQLAAIGVAALLCIAIGGVVIWILIDVVGVVPPVLWQWFFEVLGWILGVTLWLVLMHDCWKKLHAATRWWERILPVAGLILFSSPAWLAVLGLAAWVWHVKLGHPLQFI